LGEDPPDLDRNKRSTRIRLLFFVSDKSRNSIGKEKAHHGVLDRPEELCRDDGRESDVVSSSSDCRVRGRGCLRNRVKLGSKGG
jgi:hypothetical protein